MKSPKVRGLESFQAGEATWRSWESGAHGEDVGAQRPFPHTLPYVSLPSGYSVSFIISFYNKLVSSKETVILSSGSHSSKLTKTVEGVVGTSGFIVRQKHRWQPGLSISI